MKNVTGTLVKACGKKQIKPLQKVLLEPEEQANKHV